MHDLARRDRLGHATATSTSSSATRTAAWPCVENTGQARSTACRSFLPPRYFQQQADDVKFGALATPVGFDWDGDGDEDLICGNTAGYIGLHREPRRRRPPKWAAPRSTSKPTAKTIRIMAGPERHRSRDPARRSGATRRSASPIGTATACPTSSSTRSGARSSGIATSARTPRPELAAAEPIEVAVGRPAAQARLELVAAARARSWPRSGAPRRWSLDWNGDGLTRPGDARPRRLPRLVRAQHGARQLRLLPPRARVHRRRRQAAAAEREARPAAAAAASSASSTGTATAGSTCLVNAATPTCCATSRKTA